MELGANARALKMVAISTVTRNMILRLSIHGIRPNGGNSKQKREKSVSHRYSIHFSNLKTTAAGTRIHFHEFVWAERLSAQKYTSPATEAGVGSGDAPAMPLRS